MRIARLVPASLTALALAATFGSVPTFGQSGPLDAVKAAPAASVESPASHPGVKAAPASTPFAALTGIKAVQMSSTELDAVKGQHAHFVTLSQNELFGNTGLHVVNRNNLDNWLDLGNGELVGPGYHGLCAAALNSPKMFIPGQNPATGVGGGC